MASIVFSAAATTPVPAGHKSGHVRRRVIHDKVWNRKFFFWKSSPFLVFEWGKFKVGNSNESKSANHTSCKVPVGQKKRTFKTTYLGLLWTYWGFIPYLSTNQTFSFFWGPMTHRQNDQPLCALTAISEEAGFLICLWVKNDPLVGPQQPQISGIKSSFFGHWQTHLSCHEEVTRLWTFPLLIFLIQLTESWDFKKKIPVPYPIICNVQRLRPFAWTRHSRPHWLDLSKWTDGRTLLLLLGKNWNTLLLPRWNLPTPGSFLWLQST